MAPLPDNERGVAKEHDFQSPASVYAALLPMLKELAKEHGYALAVHGTMQRDFDLIAVPWTEGAASAHELAHAIMDFTGGFTVTERSPDYPHAPYPNAKPHGRLAWAIFLGGGPYIDLSVLPRAAS